MNAEDLIASAEYLLSRPEVERTQADLDRAANTAYYALFHELAATCANFIMGPQPTGHGRRAWQQAYRALEHKRSCSKCKNKGFMSKFPQEIINFANFYVDLQEKRHQADYDPLVDLTWTQVNFLTQTSKTVINAFRSSQEIDRRAFCVFVLFESREDPARKAEEEARERLAADERRRQQMTKRTPPITA